MGTEHLYCYLEANKLGYGYRHLSVDWPSVEPPAVEFFAELRNPKLRKLYHQIKLKLERHWRRRLKGLQIPNGQ